MNNNKDMLEKLDAMEREIQEMRERLQKPVAGGKGWVPEIGEKYYLVYYTGNISVQTWDNTGAEPEWLAAGRVFPFTPEGQAAAERCVFLDGFRARWRQSADVIVNAIGYLPRLTSHGEFIIDLWQGVYGLPKWSTAKACRAFVESEGGPEKFKEILEGGIL